MRRERKVRKECRKICEDNRKGIESLRAAQMKMNKKQTRKINTAKT